jgi:hypothetical protein
MIYKRRKSFVRKTAPLATVQKGMHRWDKDWLDQIKPRH